MVLQRRLAEVVALSLGVWAAPSAWAACQADGDSILTDRPTIANTSAVIPSGALQSENGVGVTRIQGGTTLDLPESRLRFGLGDCTELLVDLPDETRQIAGHGASGAGDIGPAVRRELPEAVPGLTVWAIAGSFLPTGDRHIAGRGPSPYLQLPWSYDLGDSWSANGMISETWHPGAANRNATTQTSFYLDRTVGGDLDLFAEVGNDYQPGAPSLNRAGAGVAYRYAPTRQIDFRLDCGLNRASPDWTITIGYSLRFDKLF